MRPQDVEVSWALEVDAIVDCGELFLNGASLGRRAWAPWRWELTAAWLVHGRWGPS
jgi:hypothetical protein